MELQRTTPYVRNQLVDLPVGLHNVSLDDPSIASVCLALITEPERMTTP
jgi:hypothetical protein